MSCFLHQQHFACVMKLVLELGRRSFDIVPSTRRFGRSRSWSTVVFIMITVLTGKELAFDIDALSSFSCVIDIAPHNYWYVLNVISEAEI